MGRIRCAIAARTSREVLCAAVVKVFSTEITAEADCDDFDGVLDFSFPKSEVLGGEEGMDAWYLWAVDKWSIIGDLSMVLCKELDRLEALSKEVGELVVGAIDTTYEYAFFAYLNDGVLKRLLVLEDEEISEEGFTLPAERGRPMEDFSEEEAERLWTSYGLPTFEHDPLGGPFKGIAVRIS